MGVKVANDISSEGTHQICYPKFMYTSGRVSTKVVKRIVTFDILNFWQFFFCCSFWPFNIMAVNREFENVRYLGNRWP